MPEERPSADTLNVLMIGLGDEVILGGGDTRDRHLEYARHVAYLHMIVYSPRSRNLSTTTLSNHLTAYPTRSISPFHFIWDACRAGVAICSREPIDLITTQDPFTTGLVGIWLKRKFGIPLHVQNHSSFFDEPFWLRERPIRHCFFNWLGRQVIRGADLCRVVNQAEQAKYVNLGISPERVAVIPVPTRLDRFLPDAPPGESTTLHSKLGIPANAPVVLWVGNPSPVKRVSVLVDAFVLVRQGHQDVHLVLIGDFSRQPAICQQVEQLELGNAIHFVGSVAHAELPSYYRLATLSAHSSAYEGLGLVMVEAAACGKPVVSTRTAGACEVVIDGETGLLCAIDDPADLADKVKILLDNPVQAEMMGAAGHRYVTQKFDQDRIVQAIIAHWRQTAACKEAI